jgi:hypothetical protein
LSSSPHQVQQKVPPEYRTNPRTCGRIRYQGPFILPAPTILT